MVRIPGKKIKKFKRISLIYVHMPSKLNAETSWKLQATIQLERSLHVRRGGNRMGKHGSDNTGEIDEGQEKVQRRL